MTPAIPHSLDFPGGSDASLCPAVPRKLRILRSLGMFKTATCGIAIGVAMTLTGAAAQTTNTPPEDPEAAYTRVITERADKIAAILDIANADKKLRVRDIIAQQYRDLRNIHDPRDAAIRSARAAAGGDKSTADAAVEKIQQEARAKMDVLHAEFLKRLNAELTPGQVDKVKDGLTYGVLQVTYDAYTKMLPELTEEQKTRIRDWLIEARELAMDGGSSSEKHAIFGKYKGKINNYLSAAGYDLKKAEQNLRR